MKLKNLVGCMILTGALSFSCAYADSAPVPAKILLNQILNARKEVAEIDSERSSATAELNAKLQAASVSIERLNNPPLSKAKLKELKSDLDRAKQTLLSLEQQLLVGQITDISARGAKKQELKKMEAQLKYELNMASLPYEDKIADAKKPIDAISEEWGNALNSYFRNPISANCSGIKKGDVIWGSNNTGRIKWTDSSGTQVCWLSIFLQDSPVEVYKDQKTVDGKYPLSIHEPNNIWVSAGNFKMAMTIDKKEWLIDAPTTVKLFKFLVDLDGLAALSVNH